MTRSAMDISHIKEKVRSYYKSVMHMLKEVMKLPQAKLYVLLAIPLTILFIITTFPYDIIIRNQLQKLEQRLGQNITVDTLDFSLIGDSYINSLNIVFKTGSVITMKDVNFNVAMNPFTTIINNTIRGEMDVKDVKYLKDDTSFWGRLVSSFELIYGNKTGIPSEGFIKLDLSDVYLKGLTVKEFAIPAVRFSSINASTVIRNGVIQINKLDLDGPDLKGSITGSIRLSQFLASSSLNLTIDIDQQSKLLENYKMLLGSLKTENNRIRLTVTGSLQNPRTDFPSLSGTGQREAPDEN
jgi:hypothetical protein